MSLMHRSVGNISDHELFFDTKCKSMKFGGQNASLRNLVVLVDSEPNYVSCQASFCQAVGRKAEK
jgi:hypothetical protein